MVNNLIGIPSSIGIIKLTVYSIELGSLRNLKVIGYRWFHLVINGDVVIISSAILEDIPCYMSVLVGTSNYTFIGILSKGLYIQERGAVGITIAAVN